MCIRDRFSLVKKSRALEKKLDEFEHGFPVFTYPESTDDTTSTVSEETIDTAVCATSVDHIVRNIGIDKDYYTDICDAASYKPLEDYTNYFNMGIINVSEQQVRIYEEMIDKSMRNEKPTFL